MMLRSDLPASNEDLRTALYAGDVFRLPPSDASRHVVADSVEAVEAELGTDMRHAQFRLGDEDFFAAVGRLRKQLYTTEPFHDLLRQMLRDAAFDPARIAFDPFRLRVVAHKGFEDPRAAPIYYAHRDTWYAHSQAEITWWIPLHDVTEAETFAFYPDWFARPVGNNSEEFDHDRWTKHGPSLRIGWQDARHGASHLYPGHVGDLEPGTVVSFAAKEAEVVLFAGSHFHQTRKNSTGRTRFSIDFRSVHLDDHAAGRGAPNVDNRSTGSALGDYTISTDSSSPKRGG